MFPEHSAIGKQRVCQSTEDVSADRAQSIVTLEPRSEKITVSIVVVSRRRSLARSPGGTTASLYWGGGLPSFVQSPSTRSLRTPGWRIATIRSAYRLLEIEVEGHRVLLRVSRSEAALSA